MWAWHYRVLNECKISTSLHSFLFSNFNSPILAASCLVWVGEWLVWLDGWMCAILAQRTHRGIGNIYGFHSFIRSSSANTKWTINFKWSSCQRLLVVDGHVKKLHSNTMNVSKTEAQGLISTCLTRYGQCRPTIRYFDLLWYSIKIDLTESNIYNFVNLYFFCELFN